MISICKEVGKPLAYIICQYILRFWFAVFRSIQVFRSITNDNMVNHKTPEPDEWNDYFAKMGRTLSDRMKQASEPFLVERVVGSMALFPSNRYEIANILSHMKPKKSYGSDGIRNEMLICCSPIIEPYIELAINKCFRKKYFQKASKLQKSYHYKDETT